MDILVFGRGKYFSYKREWLEQNFRIKGILDNRVSAGDELYEKDIPVINPADITQYGRLPIYLMSLSYIDMWKQLIRLGVEEERICFPMLDGPAFEYEKILRNRILKMEFSREHISIRMGTTEIQVRENQEWEKLVRQIYRAEFPLINAVASMTTEPVSRVFAAERGKPIDRKYIEEFLSDNRQYITGDLLEIEDSVYSENFGHEVNHFYVMGMEKTGKESFYGNLETGEGIRNNLADCFILTQTLMYIFDLKSAVKNVYRTLKPGGVALITCSGISQNSVRCMDEWGAYFNFNASALRKLFADGGFTVISAGSYGNVKTVTAHLNGLCCEDLTEEDFMEKDKYYPLIAYAVVKKES